MKVAKSVSASELVTGFKTHVANAAVAARDGARTAFGKIRGITPQQGGPLDDAPQLPGTSDRAFWIGLIIVSLSVVSGLATYLILTGLTPIVPRNEVVLSALVINAILVTAMVVVIAIQIVGLWRGWKKKVAGARLHARIVALFSLIAAVPALLLAIAATTTFSRALDSWFNQQTQAIVQNSLQVGNAYLLEHGQVIRTDIVNMARDLDDASGEVAGDAGKFRELMIGQASLRDLPVAYVIDSKGALKVAVLEDERIPYIPPPEKLIRAAEAGQVPLLMPLKLQALDVENIPYDLLPSHLVRDAQRGRVAAVTKLHNYPDAYLYVARGVEPKVVGHLRQTQEGVAAYQELSRARSGLQLAHGLLYFMISLTALFAAIWVGLWFAGLFVAPIRRLISAAQEVARGNLRVEVPTLRGEGDLRRLSQNFNTMTKELQNQRTELMDANSQLTERRRFMEAVLAGVSAGVIGLDRHGAITLVNRSAEKLLGRAAGSLIGRDLADAVPEFAALVSDSGEATAKSRRQEQVTLVIGDDERNFAVRVTDQGADEGDYGSVLTFDDVTELVSAQRTSAWAEVARRIAHEIKNPLTPIQLSAERLRRKYSGAITEDRETFDRCTDTIIRQVGDVTRMVDEFSAFARAPKPQMEDQDLREVVRAAVLDRQMAGADIAFDTKLPREPIVVSCDRRLISQAVGNLVKNAQEAIQAHAESAKAEPGFSGRIETIVRRNGDRAEIEVIDNGPGLPKQRTRLLEPYVTTKGNKGTGLGLAIVQKSVEQHNGVLSLEDAPPGPGRPHGALIRISLPIGPRSPSAHAGTNVPEPAVVGSRG
jgi:two-component system, NtrC family, nitrogen regulation sensor histidine kinase NtrY